MLTRIVLLVLLVLLVKATTVHAVGIHNAARRHQLQIPGLPTASDQHSGQRTRDPRTAPSSPPETPPSTVSQHASHPNRPTTTDALGAVFTYDAVGNRQTATYGNGVATTYIYDRLNRLVELHTTRNNTTLHRLVYTLAPNSLRTRIDATDADATLRTTNYTYDAVKRLTGESHSINGVSDFSATYRYDAVGNRISATVNGITTTYRYDSNDRLISEIASGGINAGTTNYLYDLAGNRTEKAGPLGTMSYLYDATGRLAEVHSAGELVQYRYSTQGLLIEKKLTPLVGPTKTWRYLWDVGRDTPQTIEEFSREGDGALQLDATYVFGDDLIAQTRAGATHYVLADGVGDTRALVDTGGAVTDTFRYDAWGNVVSRTGGTAIDHLHHGERYDPNAQFYYLRARWMDPSIGRFTQMDPFQGFAADPASLHKYTYANANPMAYRDPSGHFSLTNLTTVVNIIGIGSTSIHAGFRIAEGDYKGAAYEVARDAVFWGMGAGLGRVIAPLSKSALSFFSRTFVVPLEQGAARASEVLTRNMEAVMRRAGMKKPVGWQAHHIVGEAYPEGHQAMEILRRFKIDVNSPLNGVFLPGCQHHGNAGVVGLAVHCGKHNRDYERFVLSQLQGLDSEAEVVNALSMIRQRLLHEDLFLNVRGNL